ncbi:hypothetical protein L1987_20424 [Smallanthus sonchifolius]|uniref:Uncharacterized protein n=1 Tax=Smallanthus sonchifolius TaxID=185202 RepID=A0ACB9IRT1_9ASTR|nr:hypothetical protein L1987_20424 [Smallanthus sonchifolius]
MEQMASQLSATHLELHRARDLIEDAISADESGYVVARPPYPRITFMTGPEPKRTIDLTLPDPHHCHAPGKCPMWLLTESLSTKSDARTPSANKKDHRFDATSQFHENTVSSPERLEQPKPRTVKMLRIKLTFRRKSHSKPWKKAEVNESVGWLTARGKDMKTPLDYHTELTTNMSGNDRANPRACLECGSPDHLRNVCPKLNRRVGNTANPAHGRAFALGANEARQDPNMSFVSTEFEPLHGLESSNLK